MTTDKNLELARTVEELRTNFQETMKYTRAIRDLADELGIPFVESDAETLIGELIGVSSDIGQLERNVTAYFSVRAGKVEK